MPDSYQEVRYIYESGIDEYPIKNCKSSKVGYFMMLELMFEFSQSMNVNIVLS